MKILLKQIQLVISSSLVITALMFTLWYFLAMPGDILQQPVSVVLEDMDGRLLGARVSDDQQWRFPHNDQIPEKFKTALLQFEDKRFYNHPGIDPIALVRAAIINTRKGKIVSGGSTITMQLSRLLEDDPPRNFLQKAKEMLIALRLEVAFSKDELLALYCSYAPFGGNVVGLDAASWRYFGREPANLGWAEAATLAVLPNNPALVHPGRNRAILESKRNALLEKLKTAGILDTIDFSLAILEPIPGRPLTLPDHSPHLTEKARNEERSSLRGKGQSRILTSIDGNLQRRVNNIVNRHSSRKSEGGINDMAAIVVDIRGNRVLAYVGNSRAATDRPGYHVDILESQRSPGSILKPFLYTAMVSEGEIYPGSLVKDIPTSFGSYRPRNYNRGYTGVMPAWQALARSLNVPTVRMLKKYGVERFYHVLETSGITTLYNHPDHYGLSLVLGGSEVIPLEIAGIYGGMARQLMLASQSYDQVSATQLYGKPSYKKPPGDVPNLLQASLLPYHTIFKAGAIWHTVEALLEVERPSSERGWESYGFQQPVAWKTGTSFGFRDAWAIGMNTKHLVLVWAGNADGKGVQNLTGIDAAAPVLFDIFRELPTAEWFEKPYNSMRQAEICKTSGYPPSEACPGKDTIWMPQSAIQTQQCPYHKYIFLDETQTYQVNASCEKVINMIRKSWFILPPAEAYYNRPLNVSYKDPPPFRNDCYDKDLNASDFIHIIYPDHKAIIEIPSQGFEKHNRPVFELVHKNPEIKIYWHLNDRYLGETQHFHQIPVYAEPGEYELIVVDELGYSTRREFEISE